VRELAYRASFARFAGELPKIRPDHVARQCFWGGPCGSTLGAEGRSIPSGYSGRGADDRPSADDPESDEAQIALWGLLERDALAELRLLAAERPAAGGDDRPPNAPPPGARLAAAAEALTRDESLAAELSAAGLAETFPAAVRTRKPTGSQASCGTLKVSTQRSPRSNEAPVLKRRNSKRVLN